MPDPMAMIGDDEFRPFQEHLERMKNIAELERPAEIEDDGEMILTLRSELTLLRYLATFVVFTRMRALSEGEREILEVMLDELPYRPIEARIL